MTIENVNHVTVKMAPFQPCGKQNKMSWMCIRDQQEKGGAEEFQPEG